MSAPLKSADRKKTARIDRSAATTARRGSSPSESQRLRLFFFNDTATTEIYTLSLHDALPMRNSMSGTPGPAYIEYPSHVILEELDVPTPLPPSAYRLVNQRAGAPEIAEAARLIREA